MLTHLLLLVHLTVTTDQVAGSYYQGDGTGLNWTLDLKRDGSFSFEWRGCLGTYDAKSGVWTLKDDVVRLEVKRQQKDAMPQSISRVLRPVAWGSRMYLIPPTELRAFCNSVNDGSEPRSEAHGLSLLRNQDWRIKVTGPPALPQEVASLLLQVPIRGAVTALLSDGKVRINRGSRHGVRVGHVFYYQGPAFIPYEVVSVAPRTSMAALKYSGETAARGPVSTLLTDPALQPVCRE